MSPLIHRRPMLFLLRSFAFVMCLAIIIQVKEKMHGEIAIGLTFWVAPGLLIIQLGLRWKYMGAVAFSSSTL